MSNYTPQGDPSQYEQEYFTKLRIDSYTNQLREILYSKCANILEVGVGGNVLKHHLSYFKQIKHTSLDIDAGLKPDYVGSVTEMPFADNQFELCVCCQVLEHLRFEDFPRALNEIRRVSSRRVILSIPDKRKTLGLSICFLGKKWYDMTLNFRLSPCKKIDPQHYWETGSKNASGLAVQKAITNTGFRILESYRLRKHPWHCFYILDTNKNR